MALVNGLERRELREGGWLRVECIVAWTACRQPLGWWGRRSSGGDSEGDEQDA